MTRDEMIERLEAIVGPDGYDLRDQVHGLHPYVANSLDAILAALRDRPAPPDDLVTLVQRWQKARLALRDAEDHIAYGMAEQVWEIHERALLTWSPSPAPVAPPAVAGGDAPYCRECGADGKRVAYVEQHADSEEWRCKNCGQTFSWRQQAAGGDAPEEPDCTCNHPATGMHTDACAWIVWHMRRRREGQ